MGQDQPPQFLGGPQEWIKFIQQNLNGSVASKNQAPPNIYSVVVTFTIDKDGRVTDVTADNDPGYGTAAEAIRTIGKSPRWIPAIQNGYPVKYKQKQKISFRSGDD